MTSAPSNSSQAQRSTLLVAVVLGLLGSWQWHRGHTTAEFVLLGLSMLLFVAAAIAPAAVVFNRYWMMLASGLGHVNSRILLSAVFFGLMAPIGAAIRLAGHDPLDRRGQRRQSYWVRRPDPRQSRDSYERAY